MLMPRETPLSTIHLRNMLTVKEAGATVLFLAPGFYHGASIGRRSRRLHRRADARPARARRRAGEALGVGMSVETGSLPADGVRAMFDRIAPVYDAMNRMMTAGLDRRWRRLAAEAVVRPGRRRPRRVLRHRRSRRRGRACRGTRHGPRFLGAACSSGRDTRRPSSSGSRATCWRCPSRTRASMRPRSASASATSKTSSAGWRSCAASCGPAAGSRSSRSPARAACSRPSTGSGSTEWCRSSASCFRVAPRTRTCPRACAGFPGPEELAELMAAAGFGERSDPALRRRDRRAAHGDGPVSALAEISAAPGLDAYLAELEERLEHARRRARAASSREVGAEALAAGGKRLRPSARLPLDAAGRPSRRVDGRRRRRARPHGHARCTTT